MVRETNPKTPFGERLVAARKALNFETREPFALTLGVPKQTLANYERGLREMPIELLEIYKVRFGINLNWLICGEGEVFESATVPLDSRSAQLLNGFQKLPEDRQLDLLEILRMDLRREGLL
ncbi:hypothetical protein RvVAT039_04680 [Agrobacterium vitis]|uniref:helix-turn-helix domain-containing protein n=1 Tax=Rhizobium/Agrobacterium group TaxID=227290 RepID=UPI0012E8B866|nr:MULTISPECIES: helix-turn-helix transcriptional regulator [Rhizobium/Agrobacterium group]MCF1485045.1 helix-turn-helix transcriptional regulator [Allorhizobium ampelinum]MCF1492461.1 helix-turn-helix transcriptional regulator [Allorhizobium ampelinum]MVA44451.1 hypothetical protein [Agrobacterium vitis]NSZ48488.1 helix-turn-helix transcriptional regulator [Agrobacterium vitis]UJL73082.1 helix-turn-helix transcriptional regulator [Agrobacterium vitis]